MQFLGWILWSLIWAQSGEFCRCKVPACFHVPGSARWGLSMSWWKTNAFRPFAGPLMQSRLLRVCPAPVFSRVRKWSSPKLSCGSQLLRMALHTSERGRARWGGQEAAEEEVTSLRPRVLVWCILQSPLPGSWVSQGQCQPCSCCSPSPCLASEPECWVPTGSLVLPGSPGPIAAVPAC